MPKPRHDNSDSPVGPEPAGMRRCATSYGDEDFSHFPRKAFIKGTDCPDEAIDRPVIGIADTSSAYNPCHAC